MGLLITILLVLTGMSVVILLSYYLGIFLKGKLSPAAAGRLSGIIHIVTFSGLMLIRLVGDQYRGYRLFEYFYLALLCNGYFILFFNGFSTSKSQSISYALSAAVLNLYFVEIVTHYRFERYSSKQSLGIQASFMILMCLILYFFQKEHSRSVD